MPRPVAIPIGNRPQIPMAIVMIAATKAVTAMTIILLSSMAAVLRVVPAASRNFGAPLRSLPFLSAAVPMMRGFRARM